MPPQKALQYVGQQAVRCFRFERQNPIDDVRSSLVCPAGFSGLHGRLEGSHHYSCRIRTQGQRLTGKEHRLREASFASPAGSKAPCETRALATESQRLTAFSMSKKVPDRRFATAILVSAIDEASALTAAFAPSVFAVSTLKLRRHGSFARNRCMRSEER